MARIKNPPGPTGQTVAKNLQRLREKQRMTYAELSRRLEDHGNPIPPLGLRRIEELERKVDADDLISLAFILGTTPDYLLMPDTPRPDDQVEATALPDMSADDLWSYFQHGYVDPADPLDAAQTISAMLQTRPKWQFDREMATLRQIADQHDAGDNG